MLRDRRVLKPIIKRYPVPTHHLVLREDGTVKRGLVTASVLLEVCAVALSQPDVSGLLEQALQNELRVDRVEVHLRMEVKRPRYTREQMRQWRFNEELIRQAHEQMNTFPETEAGYLRLRFDNQNKLFEGVWKPESKGAVTTSIWSVEQARTLINEKAAVSAQAIYSKQGDLRRELDRDAPTWPPLTWQSEIWRYRIWHSHLPNRPSGVKGLKIEPVTGNRQRYVITDGKVSLFFQISERGPLIIRYTVTDLKSSYPEYEEIFTYNQTQTDLPYPSRVTISRYLVPPEGYAKVLRIPYRTPTEITTYTVERVHLNPVFDKKTFEEGPIARGTFVQDNRFEPPLIYVQGNRQFSESDLFRMAQNRELLQDADWMGYRPRPTTSTYGYLVLGLVVTAIAIYFLSRVLRGRFE